MRKDGIDQRRYRRVQPIDILVRDDVSEIELRESYEKRVVITLNDWQAMDLIKKLAMIPRVRAARAARLRAAFEEAAK